MTYESDINLLPYNTFGISVQGKTLVRAKSREDVQHLAKEGKLAQGNVFILGGGSNVLLTQDYDGLIVKIEIQGKEIVSENEEHVYLKVGAGETWHPLVQYCVGRNWGGIENLSLIPGTVGAAPMQNIGAYGCEIKEVIHQVEAIDRATGAVRLFSNEECAFGYRDSVFKQNERDHVVISSVTLRLTKRNHKVNISYGAIQDTLKALGHSSPTVQAISEAVIHIRQSKLPDPAVIGNAGSFFKNPTIPSKIFESLSEKFENMPSYPAQDGNVKLPAAWLIEQCGWKGKTFDQIGVHQHQSLVLVNYGGGKGRDIWQLAMKIQASVREKFDILLQPEVNIL
jgi:UDP-N-acetylmuramate dehydrogenase